jgi:hypothetical protein
MAFKQSGSVNRSAAIGEANMHRHVEYCRRPEYKEYKSAYDQHRRDRLQFGEFSEVARILRDVDEEIASRATRQEIYQSNGRYNGAIFRRRALK